jgi:GMP synthase (glutamine-hydrolysing)
MILILDFGSQYTQLIARRVRELSVYCEILPCNAPAAEMRARAPHGVILSGGPASVYAEGAPPLPDAALELGVPVLGICYGMQLLAHRLGGRVERSDRREYGPARLRVERAGGLFDGFAPGTELDVWMSHGDRIEALPPGFETTGSSDNTTFAAAADTARRLYGVQFHPEVAHTPRGIDVLRNFVVGICGAPRDWTAASFVEHAVERLRADVGTHGRVLMALSGGVDSTVAAALLHRAIGPRLTCVFVDNGVLRKDERARVEALFAGRADFNLRVVDARERFLAALRGVEDPEVKRKAIGRVFIEVFEAEAAEIEGVEFLAQGTLYPDVIESVSFKGPSATIKSHHNVGGLPERMKLRLVEPLRELFKDEVRRVGAELQLPRELVWRQPFPGPGLAVRVVGAVTAERLALLREADAIVEQEVRAAGLYEQTWQAFAVLLPVRSVGVMGDERTYGQTICVRAVNSQDGMTADWARLPYEVLGVISARIMNEVHGINRVVYDVSSKPPATIEWE